MNRRLTVKENNSFPSLGRRRFPERFQS